MADDVLVTGGSGFIGTYLIEALVEEGHSVTVFDNDFRQETGGLSSSLESVHFKAGDIRDYDDFAGIPDPNRIYHLAAINGTKNFYEIPGEVIDVNFTGVQNITRFARECGVDRLVFTSTSEVYGFPTEFPTGEDHVLQVMDPENPRYSYAASKIAGEVQVVNAADGAYDYCILRPHNIYGPKMGYDHVIPEFIERIVTGAEFTIYGDGEQTRSFCYISDAIDGLLEAGFNPNARNKIYNLGNADREVTINELAEELFSIAGVSPEVRHVLNKELEGSPTRRRPDLGKISRELGYSPEVDLTEGLEYTYDWYESALVE